MVRQYLLWAIYVFPFHSLSLPGSNQTGRLVIPGEGTAQVRRPQPTAGRDAQLQEGTDCRSEGSAY